MTPPTTTTTRASVSCGGTRAMKAAATTTATTRGVAAPLSYRRGSHAGDDNTYADVATSSRRGSPRARRLSTPSIAMAPFRNPFEEMKKANEIKRAKKEKGVKDGLETLVDKVKARSIALHWSPYDPVGVVNADP